MSKPITDKAEVALEYPDKLYIGTFEHNSRFDAHVDATGVSLALEKTGDEATRKTVHLHLNYGLFANVLAELANAFDHAAVETAYREQVADAAARLARVLQARGLKKAE